MIEVITSTATIVNPELNGAINQLLVTGLHAALLALVGGLTWGVKLGLNSMKSSWKRTIAERLVKFAFQRIEPNEEKRAYVAGKLHEKFPRISKEEVEHLLEEAVVNLKQGISAQPTA